MATEALTTPRVEHPPAPGTIRIVEVPEIREN